MKKQFAKSLALFLSAVLAAGSLAACTSASSGSTPAPSQAASSASAPATGEETKLVFWHTYSEGEEKVFQEKVVPGFEAANPGIQVEAVRMPYDGLNEQFIAAVAGDAAPDVMRMDLTWVSQMAKMGALAPLDDMEGFAAAQANALPGPMQTNLFEGQHYGLPLNSNTIVAIYNKERLAEFGFTEPPKTMDELLAAKDKADPDNEKWLFAIQGTFSWAMLPYIWTLGGTITDESYTKATGYLNSPETVAALQTIYDWKTSNIIGPSILGEQPDFWGGMEGGNYMMIVDGPWFFSSKDNTDTVVPALIPSVDGRSISIVGGENVVMSQNSQNKEAAWALIQYMTGDEAQLAMAEGGMIPTTTTALDKLDTSQNSYLATFVEQLKTANPRTPSPNWNSIDEVLSKAFEQVMRGEKTPQEALDAAAAEVDALLAE